MSVYVTYLVNRYSKRPPYSERRCMVWADTEDELRGIMAAVGLRWNSRQRTRDALMHECLLTESQRKAAISAGAIRSAWSKYSRLRRKVDNEYFAASVRRDIERDLALLDKLPTHTEST